MSEAGSQGPVFVVGAGPSGLAAAHRLTRRGVDVVVLERRDRVGGQLLTVRRDGFLMETGATVLPEAYSSVMALVDEIGMRDELIPSNSLMGFVRDAKLHLLRADNLAIDAARTKLLSTRAKLQVGKLAFDAMRIGKLLSYEDLSVASAYDVESPAAYARRRGIDGELYDFLIEPTVRAGAGVPGDVISVVEFFFLWQKVLGTKLYAFRDGYSSFMERIAAPLDVRLGVTVEQVIEDADGVEITWTGPDGQHTERGAGAVVSSMGNEVPDLLPQLDPDRAAFLRDLRYTSCININVGLARPPANMPASFVVFPRPASDALFAIIAEHNKAPGRTPPGKGLIGLYSMNEWAVEHADEDDDTLLAGLLRDAEPLMPGLDNDIEFARVNRWYPVLVYSHPGLYRELGRFHATRRRNSRIHLAGSYNSSGNVNTAVAAGERAARELGEALGTPAHAATARRHPAARTT
ncbi:protoporphyrinogen/coproporphyrinogen oxidase [Mycobacterium palustre]|nr:NAD(P)/FAD-dependent oxidoreductase [Mycobacterium palustre]